jgi:hypothetical protein
MEKSSSKNLWRKGDQLTVATVRLCDSTGLPQQPFVLTDVQAGQALALLGLQGSPGVASRLDLAGLCSRL